jgi:Ras-related protein Rab-22
VFTASSQFHTLPIENLRPIESQLPPKFITSQFACIEIEMNPPRRRSLSPVETKKIILLGETGVGKTSLAGHWLGTDYDPDVRPTIGASHTFKDVDVDGQPQRIMLWDTAGQEHFRAMTPLYVRSASCGIIVVAATSPESFDAIPEWLDLLTDSSQTPIPAILAVNKMDLKEDEEKLAHLIDLFRSHFVAVYCVSALTGENVEGMFTESIKIASTAATQQTTQPIHEKHEEPGCC